MKSILKSLRWVALAAFLIVVGAGAGLYLRAKTGPSWIEYVSPDARFAIQFPTLPVQVISPGQPPLSDAAIHSITAAVEGGAYQLAFVEVPPEAQFPEAGLLAATRQQFPGELRTLGSGLFRLDTKEGSITFCVRRVGDTVYRLSVSHPPWYRGNSQDIAYFFGSFSAR